MSVGKTVFVVSLLIGTSQLQAQEYLGIETYKCREFLSDSEKPNEPSKIVRSLVTIAWATGFAAAHQQNNIRADAKAMHLVAVMAGDICRSNPDKIAVEVIAPAISGLAIAKNK